MPRLTSIERLALKQGIKQGIEQGSIQSARDLVFQTLEVRFGNVPDSMRQQLEQCKDVEQLRRFHQRALTAGSVTELWFEEGN